MKFFISFCLLASSFIASASNIDLFVLAGQSNAQGYTSFAKDYPVDPTIDNKIRLFWYNDWAFPISSSEWISMQPQPRNTSGDSIWGPEVTFSRKLKQKGYHPAVFKYAVPGSSIAKNWKTPGEGGLYDNLKRQLDASIKLLEGQGHRVSICGFIWIQGEYDSYNASDANSYKNRLISIINDFRQIYGEQIPFILGVDEQYPSDFINVIVRSQREIANSLHSVSFTSMYGLPKYDATHLASNGVMLQGERLFSLFRSLLQKRWINVWSNFGSGNINGHKVKDGDIFYMGDFDGDGSEELLCVGYTSGGANDWITVLKYVNDNWEWHWSNYGSSSAGNGIYSYRNNFIVGDFDGDGKDELLGNDINGWTTLFKFNNGNWQWTWSDNGKASHPIRPYKDKFYAGDFNGDGKDELFGCDLPNGWTATFKWDGGNFIEDWSDYGSNHAIRPYRANMLPGDFDGDGKVEMLGFDGWSTLFHFDNGNWQWGWSTYGANSIGGWTCPPLSTDRVLAGNLDSDNKDELFFLQTHPAAAWAATMDLKKDQSGWNWNWSANPQYGVPYIDDWSLASNGGSGTKYYLVAAKANEPEYLLAMRKFCGNYLVNMYKTNISSNYRTANEEAEDGFNSFRPDGDISVFPNPSDGKIQILLTKSDILHVEIFDLRGQVIYKTNGSSLQKKEIDLSNYPVGIYVLKLTDSHNTTSIHKIIINR